VMIDSNGKAIFYTFDGGAKFAIGATTLVAGTYYFLGTVDASTSTIFVNGVSDGTVASSGSYTGYSAPNRLIASNANGTTMNAKAGRRDAVAWYTTALTSARGLAHYQAGVVAAAADPTLGMYHRIVKGKFA
jgi:hypothetical protein